MIKKVTFESSLLAGPLRFVQITDVHIGSRSKAFLDQVIRKVKALRPEFLCITGDFIDARGVDRRRISGASYFGVPRFILRLVTMSDTKTWTGS